MDLGRVRGALGNHSQLSQYLGVPGSYEMNLVINSACWITRRQSRSLKGMPSLAREMENSANYLHACTRYYKSNHAIK